MLRLLVLLLFIPFFMKDTIASERTKNNIVYSQVQHRKLNSPTAGCGRASYYSRKLSGRKTASGQRYNPARYTAASRTLRFGQRVLVVNPRNGKQVVVRINDRGPAKWTNRIIDLSEGAFKEIADRRQGIVKVCLKVL